MARRRSLIEKINDTAVAKFAVPSHHYFALFMMFIVFIMGPYHATYFKHKLYHHQNNSNKKPAF